VTEIPVSHRPRRFGQTKYGIHNRLWRGLVDLWAVRWMKRRWISEEGVEEVRPPRTDPPPERES
jgi:hypothetical protein